MEQIAAVLEREGELLDILLFKLVETRLLLESGEHRFLARATREVERARRRTREADLVRAASVADLRRGTTLRAIAAQVPEPWPGILRDHHEHLTALVAEIELTAHRNADLARCGLDSLRLATVSRGGDPPPAPHRRRRAGPPRPGRRVRDGPGHGRPPPHARPARLPPLITRDVPTRTWPGRRRPSLTGTSRGVGLRAGPWPGRIKRSGRGCRCGRASARHRRWRRRSRPCGGRPGPGARPRRPRPRTGR